jgi:hypothetical protein
MGRQFQLPIVGGWHHFKLGTQAGEHYRERAPPKESTTETGTTEREHYRERALTTEREHYRDRQYRERALPRESTTETVSQSVIMTIRDVHKKITQSGAKIP